MRCGSGLENMTLRVGIVGHRQLDSVEESFVARASEQILQQIRNQHADILAVSAIAEGADTLFAEAAINLGLPLEVVRPFDGYRSDFVDESSRERYNRLHSSALREVQLNYSGRSDAAYEAAMAWVVQNSQLLVAAWDGRAAKGPGGTGHAVERAIRMNRDWIHLNTVDFSMTEHRPVLK
jgi:hypothetical protein